MAKLVFILVGPRAGKDFVIPSAGVEFKDGVYEHQTSGPADPTVAGLINILGSLYNAHPEGSDELEAAELAWEEAQGAPAPVDLSDMTNKELIAHAAKTFDGAIIAGNKTELLAQIAHLQGLVDNKDKV